MDEVIRAFPDAEIHTLPADDVRHCRIPSQRCRNHAGRGGPPRGTPAVLNVLVGDAAGQAYFAKNCSGATPPLAIWPVSVHGIQTHVAAEFMARRPGRWWRTRRRWWRWRRTNPVMVTVTPPSSKGGRQTRRIDDFLVPSIWKTVRPFVPA